MLTWVSFQHLSSYLAHELDGVLRAKCGLSTVETNLLGHLGRKGVDWRMTDFTEALQLSKAGVTKLVDRLEGEGLVSRTADKDDRRVTLVKITAKGTRALGAARVEIRSFVQEHFLDVLSAGQLEDMSEALKTLLEAHGRWEGQMRFLAKS